MKQPSVTSWVCITFIIIFGFASLSLYLQLQGTQDIGGMGHLILYMTLFCLVGAIVAWPATLMVEKMAERKSEKWASQTTPEQQIIQTKKNKTFIRTVLAVFGLFILFLVMFTS